MPNFKDKIFINHLLKDQLLEINDKINKNLDLYLVRVFFELEILNNYQNTNNYLVRIPEMFTSDVNIMHLSIIQRTRIVLEIQNEVKNNMDC